MVRSRKELEVELSKLKSFEKPSLELEQYATPSSIASDWVWQMALNGEVAGRTILDAACGPGIIGIALLLMGAKKVYFVDKDESAIKLCVDNYNKMKERYDLEEAEFITEDISLFDQEVDIVVQNPPFGTKTEHADKRFLEKAFELAPLVYSMHKFSTKSFVEAIAKDFNFNITRVYRYDFAIKSTFKHHKKPVVNVDVGLWRLEKES
jgi:putative methylase